jgi:uncharacterized protein with FMN-binding domain
MRRALLTLGGTAAGLAALLSFKTHTVAAAAPAPVAPASSASSAAPSMAGGTGSSTARSTASPTASASSGSATMTRTVTGTVANTDHGPMQVQLTLAGTKITKVTVLQRTNDGAESDEIDATAIPKLTSETLAAQDAMIDAVSGASYTSQGYIQSLQSALDKAGS